MLYRSIVVFVSMSLFSGLALSQELSGRFDLSYSEANPDYSPFPNGEGISAYARLVYDHAPFVYLRYSDADFRPSGPVSGAEVESWQEVGIGYTHELHAQWSLEGGVSSQKIEQGGDSENGHEIYIGAQYRPLDKLALDLSVGKLDLQIDDWNLDFEARYTVFENLYIVTKLRDYADWDFTYYEAGLGVSF